ncbi:MAG: hypothetical protein ACOYJY_01375 [Acutalibacteraceae bacterium]
MKDLKKIIKYELEQETDRAKIIETLKKINEKFLNEYHLDIDGFIIDPLVIEAYYHKKGVFEDGCVHAAQNEGKIAETARNRQKKNFGGLYIHNVKNKNDGLDICLSDGEYYYSLLIKNAILNGEKFATQSQVSMELCAACEKCENCSDVNECIYNERKVVKRNQQDKKLKILHLPRKNVRNTDALAAVSLQAIKKDIQGIKLTLAAGFGKQWEASVVAIEESANEADEEMIKKFADRLNGSKVEKKYFENAKKILE